MIVFDVIEPFADQYPPERQQGRAEEQADEAENQHATKNADDDQQARRAHLERLHDLLQSGGDAGRRLDFTLQECFREINTCGNKLPDVQLSRLVVDFKNELEKCREQVQNLE